MRQYNTMRPPAPRKPPRTLLQQQLISQAQTAGAGAPSLADNGERQPADATAPRAGMLTLRCSGDAAHDGVSTLAAEWSSFFDSKEELELPARGGTFRSSFVSMLCSPNGARNTIVMLQTCRLYRAGTSGPLLFFIHGGGYSSMSWAACIAHLDKSKCAPTAMTRCRSITASRPCSSGPIHLHSAEAPVLGSRYQVLAMDARGHGATVTQDDADLSVSTLTEASPDSDFDLGHCHLPPEALRVHSMRHSALGPRGQTPEHTTEVPCRMQWPCGRL